MSDSFTLTEEHRQKGYSRGLMAGLSAHEKRVLVTLDWLSDKALDRLTAHVALNQDMKHSTWGFKTDGSPGDAGCLIAVSMSTQERAEREREVGSYANLIGAYDEWGHAWAVSFRKQKGVQDVGNLAKRRLYEVLKREHARRHANGALGDA